MDRWVGVKHDVYTGRSILKYGDVLYCGGAFVVSNQNPRWTQKPCISLCPHTILGSHYYKPPK